MRIIFSFFFDCSAVRLLLAANEKHFHNCYFEDDHNNDVWQLGMVVVILNKKFSNAIPLKGMAFFYGDD